MRRSIRFIRQFVKRCRNCGHQYNPSKFANCPECREDLPYWLKEA